MKRKFLILFIVLIIGSLVVGLISRYRRIGVRMADAPTASLKRQDRPVAPVTRGELTERLPALATVRPIRTTALSAQLTARILDVLVREGDRIVTGEILVRMDAREWRSQTEALNQDLQAARDRTQAAAEKLEAARATETRWLRDQNREEALVSKGATPVTALDAARDRYETARAARAVAERELAAAQSGIAALQSRYDAGSVKESYTVIAAPYSGVISGRFRDPGDLAIPGQPILQLVDDHRLTLEFELAEAELPRLKIGQRILTPRLSAVPVTLRIIPQLTPQRMVRLETDFDNPASSPLLPGQSLPIELEIRHLTDVVTVPRTALAESSDGPAVFRIRSGESDHVVHVSILGRDGERVAVEGNLREGDYVRIGSWLQWLRYSAAALKINPLKTETVTRP